MQARRCPLRPRPATKVIQLTFTTDGDRWIWSVLDIVPAAVFVDALIRSPQFARLRDEHGGGPPKGTDVDTRRVETGLAIDGSPFMEWCTSVVNDRGWPHERREREAVVHRYDPNCERNESDQKVQ